MYNIFIYIYICILTIYMYFYNLRYSSYLRILIVSENISHCDLEVYINHLDKLRVFKLRFGYFDNTRVPEWLVTPFSLKIDNKGYESDLY